MRTNGACGLLFCAAKRSGAFPPNMPAGVRARVLRLGGFTRPFCHVLRVIVSPSWGLALCHHEKTEKMASTLAEAATKPKTGLNSVVVFFWKNARLIGLHKKSSRFKRNYATP